jgi:phenylpropionate dioxygenase-like ring-hydroxylating dioxygenase large terminal subunit
MGEVMRRYWVPALLSWEIAEPDSPPVIIKLLGEELVAFRDTDGKVGIVGARCAHRRAHMFWGRNEECGLRCVYHGWKFDVNGACRSPAWSTRTWARPRSSRSRRCSTGTRSRTTSVT